MNTDAMTLFTIGHSNHGIEQFLDLLKLHDIRVILDVRSSPYSQYASHFNKEAFEHALAAHGLRYVFLGDRIGGRPKERAFYDAAGHVLYDRLAASPRFEGGVRAVLDVIPNQRAALLCGEEDPSHCHRRILITRVLVERGVAVRHIRGDGRVETEEEVAAAEEFERTGGQLSLFEEPPAWRSTQSVLPKEAPPSSSRP